MGRKVETVRDLVTCLREGSYTSLGSYPLYYLTADGGTLLPSTVRAELWQVARAVRDGGNEQWRVVGCEVNWEDPSMYDAHTGERIPSAYAEPEPTSDAEV